MTFAGGSIGTLRGTGDTDGNISQRPDDRLLLPEGKQQSYGMQKAVRGRVPGRECSGGTDGLPGKAFSELKMPYDTVLAA